MKTIPIVISGLLAVLIWSAIPIIVKLALFDISASQYLFMRFGISLLVMSPWLNQLRRKHTSISAWIWAALLVDLGANYFFQTVAMHELPSSWYIVIFALNPILVFVFLRTPLNRRLLISLAVATLGTLVFTQMGDFHVPIQKKSLLCLVIGMLTWVIYTVIISKLQRFYSDLEITLITQLLSFFAAYFVWGIDGFPFLNTTGHALYAVLFLGICTPLAYFSFSYALRHIPAFGVASQYMEPVFGVALAYLVFGEKLSPLQMMGAMGIVGATVSFSKSD